MSIKNEISLQALEECPRFAGGMGEPMRGVIAAVLIIEDHPMILRVLQASLRRLCPDIEQICVRDASAALGLIARCWFRVFVDPDALGVDEAALVHALSSHGLASRCCLISSGARDQVTPYLRDLECLACVSTRMPIYEFDAALARMVLGIEAPKDGGDDPAPCMTERHVELLRLLQQGLPNKIIAHQLGISEGTVRNHLHVLMRRLGVRNRTQAAQAATRFGIA